MPEDPGEPTQGVSIWSLKPWWCQPWSILITGIALPLGSWLLVHRWWVTVPLAAAVLTWWGLFLVLMPRAFREQTALLRRESTQP
ncbi:DUF6737 family protein [Synechococcus sp. GFB01]|uniref:DUF6737 family protein n=1 Tax=Synechococcus sp. GFB01 TaxID=1662190 RepID=UPI000907F7F2|nr:DUF6737 family protein [Synechococcus sp. GFB01]